MRPATRERPTQTSNLMATVHPNAQTEVTDTKWYAIGVGGGRSTCCEFIQTLCAREGDDIAHYGKVNSVAAAS